jgi:hypothetical protein
LHQRCNFPVDLIALVVQLFLDGFNHQKRKKFMTEIIIWILGTLATLFILYRRGQLDGFMVLLAIVLWPAALILSFILSSNREV